MLKTGSGNRRQPLAGRAFAVVAFVLFAASTVGARDFVDLVTKCESCHGKDGVSSDPKVPTIAGFSYEGFLNTMDVFRENDRIALAYQVPGEPETVMNEIARNLSDDEVEALSKYFSERPFVAAVQPFDGELAARGEIIHKANCERCHSGNGAEPVDDAAILAGQWMPYLERQFDNVLSGKRLVPRSMYRRLKRLESSDIQALLHFYAREGDSG